ncbi:MAG: glucosaminidase domain-containing protein [Saprospiraceae bacterium]
MILEFVKKRWFTIALVVLALFAVVRKNTRTSSKNTDDRYEKYTDTKPSRQSNTMLNVASSGASGTVRFPPTDEAQTIAFLKRFAQVAIAEQRKFGIPASVLLACAYVNSFAGQRACATEANNYLANHCTNDWAGPTLEASGSCFKKYETAWESIRDFNVTNSNKAWYTAAKNKARPNWKPWANAMAKSRVSDVENVEAEMICIIEEYRLFELDEE